MLELRPGWGELYSILGMEPASLAAVLRGVLLPRLASLSAADRARAADFMQQRWAQGTRWCLRSDQALVDALSGVAFLPAEGTERIAPAAAAGAAAQRRSEAAALLAANAAGGTTAAADSSSSSGNGHSAPPAAAQLYMAAQLYDPRVSLFAKMLPLLAGGNASEEAVLFPAPPYDSEAWLPVCYLEGTREGRECREEHKQSNTMHIHTSAYQ